MIAVSIGIFLRNPYPNAAARALPIRSERFEGVYFRGKLIRTRQLLPMEGALPVDFVEESRLSTDRQDAHSNVDKETSSYVSSSLQVAFTAWAVTTYHVVENYTAFHSFFPAIMQAVAALQHSQYLFLFPDKKMENVSLHRNVHSSRMNAFFLGRLRYDEDKTRICRDSNLPKIGTTPTSVSQIRAGGIIFSQIRMSTDVRSFHGCGVACKFSVSNPGET